MAPSNRILKTLSTGIPIWIFSNYDMNGIRSLQSSYFEFAHSFKIREFHKHLPWQRYHFRNCVQVVRKISHLLIVGWNQVCRCISFWAFSKQLTSCCVYWFCHSHHLCTSWKRSDKPWNTAFFGDHPPSICGSQQSMKFFGLARAQHFSRTFTHL